MIKETQKGLQCCSERHLLRSALAMAIYSKIGAITYGGRDGGKYFGTLETLADLFGCAPNSVWRAIKWLVKAGFLERIETTDGSEHQLRAVCFQSKEYRYVSHEEWAGKHPGQCYQALAVPWDCLGEDELSRRLWEESRGETRWYANQLACLRKSWPTDDEIVSEWEDWLARLEKPCVYAGQWKSAQGKFLRFAKQLQAEKANAEKQAKV